MAQNTQLRMNDSRNHLGIWFTNCLVTGLPVQNQSGSLVLPKLTILKLLLTWGLLWFFFDCFVKRELVANG